MTEAVSDDDDFASTFRLPIVVTNTPEGEVWTVSLGPRVLAALERHAHRNGFGNSDPLRRLLALADMIDRSSNARADRLN
jgi:hypothetical protein